MPEGALHDSDVQEKYAALCRDFAKEVNCNFFMFNHEYPVSGCHCCEDIDATIHSNDWNIYQVSCDSEGSPYDKCYNQRALKVHNQYRDHHGVHHLELDHDIAVQA